MTMPSLKRFMADTSNTMRHIENTMHIYNYILHHNFVILSSLLVSVVYWEAGDLDEEAFGRDPKETSNKKHFLKM